MLVNLILLQRQKVDHNNCDSRPIMLYTHTSIPSGGSYCNKKTRQTCPAFQKSQKKGCTHNQIAAGSKACQHAYDPLILYQGVNKPVDTPLTCFSNITTQLE